MHSFCIRYAIALGLVLTQQFAFAYAENVTSEHTSPAKVVTSFLKVPWINLNSSWTNEVTSHCRNDVTTLFKSADDGEMWALQMLDAASRIPSGILMGNIVDLGQYDECIRVTGHDNSKNIQGQYCMISFSIPSKFVKDASKILYVQKISFNNPTAGINPSLTLSVCLPSSCSIQDIVGFVNASIQNIPTFVEFEVSVSQVKCPGIEPADDPTIGTILTISFIGVIACVLLLCTVCDFVVRANSGNSSIQALKTLAKFSIYTNTINLFNTEITPETIPTIHGMRFLSTSLIMIFHRTILTLFIPSVNMSDINEARQSVAGIFILIIPYTVDTFFVISGFLTAYLFLNRMKSGKKFNILEFYLHRYIRLATCIVILLLLVIFILPHLVSGPLGEIDLRTQIDNCRKHWWATLLLISNFASRQEMCFPHTWTSAIEMQFCLFCPIILYPLFHRPKLGLTMLGVLTIISIIIPAVQIIVNNYSFFWNFGKSHAENFNDFFNSYTITYNRVLPYFVGIFLGYDMVNNKRRFTKVQAAFNWILVCIFILFCFWNANFIQPKALEYSAISEAIHISLGRLAWSLTMAWIIYACTEGYGGPVTRFLSLPVFIPLSRLSHSIYLVHFLLQAGVIFAQRNAVYYSTFVTLYPVMSDLVMSILLAFILYVCIEIPAITLEKVMRAKRSTAII